MDITARFCSECGAAGNKAHASVSDGRGFGVTIAGHRIPGQLTRGHDHPNGAKTQLLHRTPIAAPKFVKPHTEVPLELKQELGKLIVLLARERMFLYFQVACFLAINMIGFYLAMRAYNEYAGDEVTKFIISLTPMMFINTLALVILCPIKGTKREIARLKEKLSYVKFQIDYRNVF
jgi:hypothetical protein